MDSIVSSTSATGETAASRLLKTQAGQTYYRGALLVKGMEDGFLPQDRKEARRFHELPMSGSELDAAVEATGRRQWSDVIEGSEPVSC